MLNGHLLMYPAKFRTKIQLIARLCYYMLESCCFKNFSAKSVCLFYFDFPGKFMKMFLTRYLWPLVIAALLLANPVLAEAANLKIAGRVFTKSGPLAGARVYVHKTYADLLAKKPLLISDPADRDGVYTLELPTGEYYFTALGSDQGMNFSAYHGANPISIGKGNLWIALLAHEEKQPTYSDGEPAVQGVVTFKGRPVSSAQVAIYTLDAQKFKGLGFLAEKGLGIMKAAAEDGTFAIPLMPGRYVVIARKTANGNGIRPLVKGDLFCYLQVNPIEVLPDQTVHIEIPCHPKGDRSSFVDTPKITNNDYLPLDGTSEGSYGIKGKVIDNGGKGVAGVYVIAYRNGNSSTPTREAENIARTDATGHYFIPLHSAGKYGLIIRETLGAAPESNDITGIYSKDPWQGISFSPGNLIDDVVITINDSDRKLFE